MRCFLRGQCQSESAPEYRRRRQPPLARWAVLSRQPSAVGGQAVARYLVQDHRLGRPSPSPRPPCSRARRGHPPQNPEAGPSPCISGAGKSADHLERRYLQPVRRGVGSGRVSRREDRSGTQGCTWRVCKPSLPRRYSTRRICRRTHWLLPVASPRRGSGPLRCSARCKHPPAPAQSGPRTETTNTRTRQVVGSKNRRPATRYDVGKTTNAPKASPTQSTQSSQKLNFKLRHCLRRLDRRRL